MLDNVLFEYQDQLLRNTPITMTRYLYHQIAWDSRMIGIVGSRGIGKSTLLLQYIKLHQDSAKHLYVSADTAWFAQHTLIDLARETVKEGITYLMIDEIHKYPNWSKELKQIYDMHPELHIIFTGSSILDIKQGEADLSRRALMYHMQGLSFREYMHLFHGIQLPIITLEQILANQLPLDVLPHPLPYFREYLRGGYYPFALEQGFAMRVEQVVAQSIEVDILQYADMKASTARRLRHLLTIVSSLAPYKPNIDSLSQEVGVSKNNLPDYLLYMEKVGLIGLLRDDTMGLRGLGKIEKLYIDNATLMTILAAGNPDVGNLRETFFYNQVRVLHPVKASRDSDFVIGDYTFEVGGENKGKRQIEHIPNGIVVRDDIEIGHANIVPLWAFGLMY